MTKKEINIFDYAGDILNNLHKGAVLVSKADGKVNAMTIGWGSIGIEWAKPIFTAYVREHRCTAELIKKSDSFTVCIPNEASPKSALGFFGSKSGYDVDKEKEAGVTFIDGEVVDTPVIKEFPLIMECKLAHYQLQDRAALNKSYMAMYPQDVDSSFHGANKDFHFAFIGEIVKAYIIEE